LLLLITIFTGSPCCIAVMNSAISIAKPPSPTNPITCRSGKACWSVQQQGGETYAADGKAAAASRALS
jgi:hypothetical protein